MHSSLSSTVSNLEMRGLPANAPDWIPMCRSLPKHALCILAPGLLIGPSEALPVSHPAGSIAMVWLAILTPVTSSKWTAPGRSVGGPHAHARSLVQIAPLPSPLYNTTFRGGRLRGEPWSQLSGSFLKHICSILKHPLLLTSAQLGDEEGKGGTGGGGTWGGGILIACH